MTDHDQSRASAGGGAGAGPGPPPADGVPADSGYFERLVADHPDGVVTVDADGTVRYANRGVRRILGFDPDELIGRPVAELFAPQYREAYRDHFAEYVAEGDRLFERDWLELTARHENGTDVEVSVSLRADEYDDERFITAVVRDRTDPRPRETKLGEPAVQFRTLARELDEYALVMLDPDGRVASWNAGAERITGYSGEAAFGEHVSTFYPADDREDGLPGRQLEAAAAEGSVETEGRWVRQDGTRFWANTVYIAIHENGVLEGFAVVVRDVTERRDRERELERYETMVNTVPDVMYVLDTEGTVEYINDAAEALTGYAQDELVGAHLRTLTDEESVERGRAVIGELLDAGEENPVSDPIEYPVHTADGETVPCETRLSLLEADGTWTGVVGVTRDLSEHKERERELTVFKQAIDQMGIGLGLYSADGHITYANDAFADHLGMDAADLGGTPIWEINPAFERERFEAYWDSFSEGETRVREAEHERVDGSTVPVETVVTRVTIDGTTYHVGTAAAITERKEQEREIERHRDELETLNRVNTAIREINRALVDASTREEIETRVCQLLAASEPYLFAWIGEPNYASGEMEPSADAGPIGDYLDHLTITLDDDRRSGRGPSGRAARTKEVCVSQDIGDDPVFEPYRELANEYGFRSAAAVPLVYETTLYGVLHVYAERAHAFDEDEQAVLAELGETIGLAINALERKQALVTDEVVELTITHTESNRFFVPSAADGGGRFTLEGQTPLDDDARLNYVTAEGTDPETLLEQAEESPAIENAKLVSDHGDEYLFEFLHTGPSPGTTLAEYGARLTEATVEDGAATLVAEVPQSADVRRIIEALESVCSEVELVSQRHADRSVSTIRTFRTRLHDELTDRQRTALEAAHYAGLFAWPREATAEELADSLDVAPPTFHQHLRAAQRKLVAAFFDE